MKVNDLFNKEAIEYLDTFKYNKRMHLFIRHYWKACN